MTRPQRPCDERACALRGAFTIYIQSEDGATMFAGLQALMEEASFNAHLHTEGDLWGALVPIDDYTLADRLSERLASVGSAHQHWVRMLVEDEKRHVIVFDRTYAADGEMREPIPG